MLTEQERDTFRAAVELARTGYITPPEEDELLDMSPVRQNDIVGTHETYADFARTHGEGKSLMYGGHQLHYWEHVQFQKGQPRGTLYLMECRRVNASFFL